MASAPPEEELFRETVELPCQAAADAAPSLRFRLAVHLENKRHAGRLGSWHGCCHRVRAEGREAVEVKSAKRRVETVYGVTSHTVQAATPQQCPLPVDCLSPAPPLE